jgi:hypothetical protein
LTEKENNSIIELLQPLVSKSFHEETIARSEYLIREGQIESFIYILYSKEPFMPIISMVLMK